jgi:hypothetical protein
MAMAGKKTKTNGGEFLLYDVIYEDGMRRSNRKVPGEEISPFDEERSVKAIIEAQDRKIAELSGRPLGKIKSISRSGR